MTLVQPENTKLTRTQEDVVRVALLPAVKTQRDIAKRRGVTDQSVSEILKLPEVRAELLRREKLRSDNARDVLTKAGKAVSRLVTMLDSATADNKAVFTLEQLAGATATFTKVYGQLLEYRDKHGIGKDDNEGDPRAIEYLIQRVLRMGIALGRGRGILGVKVQGTQAKG